jgi:hypothetical protein
MTLRFHRSFSDVLYLTSTLRGSVYYTQPNQFWVGGRRPDVRTVFPGHSGIHELGNKTGNSGVGRLLKQHSHIK